MAQKEISGPFFFARNISGPRMPARHPALFRLPIVECSKPPGASMQALRKTAAIPRVGPVSQIRINSRSFFRAFKRPGCALPLGVCIERNLGGKKSAH
jgi:hypothetical protein